MTEIDFTLRSAVRVNDHGSGGLTTRVLTRLDSTPRAEQDPRAVSTTPDPHPAGFRSSPLDSAQPSGPAEPALTGGSATRDQSEVASWAILSSLICFARSRHRDRSENGSQTRGCTCTAELCSNSMRTA